MSHEKLTLSVTSRIPTLHNSLGKLGGGNGMELHLTNADSLLSLPSFL